MNTSSTEILTTEGLRIGYRTKGKVSTVATDLHVSLRGGEFVCLLGPNGAGKSTLIRTLAGIQPALAGRVFLAGEDVGTIHKTQLAKKLSLVLTDAIQAGNLTVYTLLTLGRYPYVGWFGMLRPQDEAIIKEAVYATGIAPFLNKYLHQLSDGEKQKVMIARALVQDTPLIILDEPTAHLDLPNRVEVIRLLKRMARQTGKAIILSTHELDLALQAADTIWLMGTDQTLLSGSPEDLILEGTFERAFAREGFTFRRDTGTFQVNVPEAGKVIALQGEGTPYFWTQRALERAGYALVDMADVTLSVSETDQGCYWTLTSVQGSSCTLTSIASVLGHIHALHTAQQDTTTVSSTTNPTRA